MKYRKLRIAWSVAWGVLCVLLIALWVRSYRQWDQFYSPISNKTLILVESASGRIIWDTTIASPGARWTWHLTRELNGEYWRGALYNVQTANRYSGFGGFGHHGNQWHDIYQMPYWFLVVVFTSFAAAPWILWSRQFSLRMLLIAMTLVAVGLGWIVYVIRN